MTPSIDQCARLAKQEAYSDVYRYHGDELVDKTLVALIAPTAVGKSTVIRHILDQAVAEGIDAAEVGTWTTRDPRPGDPSNYRTGISCDEMVGAIDRAELVNWVSHPSGDIYGSAPESYPGRYNFLPMLPNALPMLQRAGFQTLRVFYLTTSAEAWNEQLQERRHDVAYVKRLAEAWQSLEWAQSHQNEITLLDNQPGDDALRELAHSVLDAVVHNTPIESSDRALAQLDDMRACVREWYDE